MVKIRAIEEFTQETKLLNYSNASIQELITDRKWLEFDDYHKIEGVYNFVKDEILFGYNVSDDRRASDVLEDGYGQCNTKGILLMALLRGVGIPCRIHGFTIDKRLQKGAMTGFVYNSAPQNILHSWVEVIYDEQWIELEGFILDAIYLGNLQNKFSTHQGSFCGFGVAVDNFKNPAVSWCGKSTYIQSKGINQDFGVYNSPDDLFKEHRQELSRFKEWLFRNIVRHLMNKNVQKIRSQYKSAVD